MTNDSIQIALIGAGGMGSGDATLARSIPGVRLIAVADLYIGRLARARERWGKDLFTSRDYREVLARPGVDAVIIATPDHWHQRITVEALDAGKHVYCEKPMVHSIDEGHEVIAAQKRNRGVFQVGSQYVSSLVYRKAKDLIAAGAIGEINMVEAWLDRNTAIGAWQYSIPPDASEKTVDWDRFLGQASKRPFDPVRFFRWRNYRDYGTGVAGDLFVHLLSGLHFATGSIGPSRVYATGGLRFWKDGRDVPDVMLALLDYPGFTTSLKVNFESGLARESFGVKFVGSEGIMTAGYTTLELSRHPREPQAAAATDHNETFTVPSEWNAHLEHHKAFYGSIREGLPPVEDAVFGLRAAGPALLTNTSYFEGKQCGWDPEKMVRIPVA